MKRLEDQITEVNKNVLGVQKTVSAIVGKLFGSELEKGDTGMAGVQKDHDERIEKLERIKDRFFWTTVGACTVGGAGFWAILKAIFNI